jgi:tetratricopeptide (TPR) repeat protein
LAKATSQDVRVILALAFARAGDTQSAQDLADALDRESPVSTSIQNYSLPTVRAAVELARHNPSEAIRILQRAAPYDTASTDSFDSLYPAYIRGLAYLQAKEPEKAAAEFQKMVDHPGIVLNFVTGALARLQLGRAQVMMSDKEAARKSYQDFLTLWKDADPDIPIFQQAKAEYAKL